MKFTFRTFGCKMNWLDSARISAGLQMAGNIPVESEDEADVILVNSCIVTAKAEGESRREAIKASKNNKTVVIFGCGPKANETKWKKHFPDAIVFGNESLLLHHFGLSEKDTYFPDSARTRLPIAIQSGCDNFCTFCVTRISRGKHESLPLEGIIRQIVRAEESGIQEIVLTGINLAAWGCDNSNNSKKSQFGKLLHEILSHTNVPRIRISSIGPQFLHEDFFEEMKNPRMCDHLHLSIQSGSDQILQKMNRGHGTKEVYEIVKKMRKIRPGTAFTADFIVGFPGEAEEDFQKTMEMVKKIGFAKLHVFPFSEREGTGAANFPDKIEVFERKNRAKKLRELGEILSKKFIESHIGKKMRVLVEADKTGLTSNYIRLKIPVGKPREFQEVKIMKKNVLFFPTPQDQNSPET
ncbi:MiaB/RimO family radical SAM methylthiotransferase [Candidatus Peregrinibacteria bacterium]|nr:MiaB/RimO family radical SAM methylthiotransferase [Candidatus Peregrinibacteria bacterium]